MDENGKLMADAGEYKAGLRAISQLIGEAGEEGKEVVKVSEIEQVLSLEVSLIYENALNSG